MPFKADLASKAKAIAAVALLVLEGNAQLNVYKGSRYLVCKGAERDVGAVAWHLTKLGIANRVAFLDHCWWVSSEESGLLLEVELAIQQNRVTAAEYLSSLFTNPNHKKEV